MLVVRSPRFTICALLLIFMTFILFFRSDNHASILVPFSNYALQEKLRLEEHHYNKMLDGRAKLIQKWGPTPDKVDP